MPGPAEVIDGERRITMGLRVQALRRLKGRFVASGLNRERKTEEFAHAVSALLDDVRTETVDGIFAVVDAFRGDDMPRDEAVALLIGRENEAFPPSWAERPDAEALLRTLNDHLAMHALLREIDAIARDPA